MNRELSKKLFFVFLLPQFLVQIGSEFVAEECVYDFIAEKNQKFDLKNPHILEYAGFSPESFHKVLAKSLKIHAVIYNICKTKTEIVTQYSK